MIRSRAWRRKQQRKATLKRVRQSKPEADIAPVAHAANPEQCGVASCQICHPEKNAGNSTKIPTRKSRTRRLLERELAAIQQIPLPELQAQF